jgi:hypothetical protein
LGKVSVETGIEAGDLRQLRLFAQQDLDGFQRERLVQWRQWNRLLRSASTVASMRVGLKYLLPPCTTRWAMAAIFLPSRRARMRSRISASAAR